jgi:hypothetical protein
VQRITLTVDREQDGEAVVDRVWRQLRVRGEVQTRRLDGKLRIDLIVERDLSDAELNSIPGKRA